MMAHLINHYHLQNYMSNGIWNLLCLLAGLLFTLGFAPFEQAYLTIISLTILILSWLDVSPKRAAWRGFLFGFSAFGLGVTWVFVSIFFYGGASLLASSVLAFLFAVFWALFVSLTAYLSVKLAFLINQQLLLCFIPFVWTFVEYFRGYWFLNGFPWLQVAYSQLDTSYSGFIPLVGVYGGGFLIILTASLCAYLIHFKQKMLLISGMLCSIFIIGYGLKQISWTQRISEKPLKITLVQGNIAQKDKWLPENLIKTLLSYQQMTYSHWDSDVIIWPETAIPAFLHQVDEQFLRPLALDAFENNTDVIVSLPVRMPELRQDFNSVLTLGKNIGIYHKNHLLPFGEYMPLQPVSGWVFDLIGVSLGFFTSGGFDQELLTAGGYPFATSICYEDAFAEEVIGKLPEAAYLVNVTNDAWFGNSLEPHQHMQIARMRALESGRYLARATNTGITAFVAPNGKIIKQAELFKTQTLTENIYPMTGMTPFAQIGNKVVNSILAIFFIILITLNYKIKHI